MTTLEKIMEINPFLNQKSQHQPEKESKVEYEKDPLIEKTIELYDEQKPCWILTDKDKTDFETLNPLQIDTVLQKILQKDEKPFSMTGPFLSKLIQKSYDNGHNYFTLNTQDTRIEKIGSHLSSEIENPLRLTVNGNAGSYFGENSFNCAFWVKGDVAGLCGRKSHGCIYNIDREIGFSPEKFGCTFITSNEESHEYFKWCMEKAEYVDWGAIIIGTVGLIGLAGVGLIGLGIMDSVEKYRNRSRIIYTGK